MALVLADRVQEYSTTTGTGTLTLSGAYAGFQTFAAGIGNGNTCYYTITSDTNQWEVGIGTVGVGTLARTTLISSSTGSLVSFTGTLTVFVTYPAEKAVYSDSTTIVAPSGALLPITSGGTGASTAAGARTALGLGTIATQAANSVAITGGAIDGTTVGSTTAAAGSFTTLNSSGDTRLGGLSGNQSLQVNNVASAVNYAQIVGAITANNPTITAVGTDTNIGINIFGKGTGELYLGGSTTYPSLRVSTPASTVNSFQIYGNVTGVAPTLAALGPDTNIGINFSAKGTGTVILSSNGQQVFAASNASGTDFTNYYNTTGQLNYTAAGGSGNTNFYFGAKGTGSIQLASGGGTQAVVTNTASAVNYLNLTGAATGAAPTISAVGSDATVPLNITSKSFGVVNINTGTGAIAKFYDRATGTVDSPFLFRAGLAGTQGGALTLPVSATVQVPDGSSITFNTISGSTSAPAGNTQFKINHTTNAVNYIQATGAVTTGAPELSAQGSDANINLKLTPKGTGTVQFGTYTAGVIAQAGYITITDAAGTSRRLLVG